MRVFLSYRRDDTGGRAGRLFDALATRYGHDAVFQDVNTVEPGLNFVHQVEAAIRSSDAVLVVIGPRWLTSTAPDGGRRVDQADDFVRRELTVALDADVRVVPVLVDGATLPLAGDLPDGLVPLLERQAVSIDDVSWRQDVDALIRRLEGDPKTDARPGRHRISTSGFVTLGVVVALVIAGAIALAGRGGEGGSASTGPPSTEPPVCSPPQSSWTTIPLADDPSIEVRFDALSIRVEVEEAYLAPRENGTTQIILDLLVTNVTDPAPPDIDLRFWYSYEHVKGLWVNGVASEQVACSNLLAEQPEIVPGQAVPARVGYTTTRETDDALFQLAVGEVVLNINSR